MGRLRRRRRNGLGKKDSSRRPLQGFCRTSGDGEVGAAGGVVLGEAGFGGFETFGFDSAKDQFLGHDEAFAFIEEVIVAKAGRGHINSDKVCAGPQAAAVTQSWFGKIQRADGGNDPVGSHEAQGRHRIQG